MLQHPPILDLGPQFWDPVRAADFPRLQLRFRNEEALRFLGLQLSPAEFEKHFGRFDSLPDQLREPLALRYHGHQFLSYNPQLGDGRGFLFAQFARDGKLWDLGTKGSGTTPYSRTGDGRLTLKGAVREALCTEQLESLGVRTSRTFAIFETGESLVRHDEPSPTRAAVLTRLSEGHIRIGSFQRLMYHRDRENLLKLRDYSIRWFYPDVAKEADAERTRAFFRAVLRSCARLVSQFMTCGFVHGVLNTDNINISGESFDYGPYRFLPHYDPEFTAAYFDQSGLYAYGRQPLSFLWNLEQLAVCLQFADPQFEPEADLKEFIAIFNDAMTEDTLRRLNLRSRSAEDDGEIVALLYRALMEEGVAFEQAWFDWHGGGKTGRPERSPQRARYATEAFRALGEHLAKYEVADEKLAAHPYFRGDRPRTLLIDEIEALWAPIAEKDDWSDFEKTIAEIRAFRSAYARPSWTG